MREAMSDVHVFTLPDVGEGLTEAEILRWHVQPGDTVSVNQMIVEIETAKAAVELPCPYSGTVETLHVDEGAVVPVGAPIISIAPSAGSAAPERQSVLVGYGVKGGTAGGRRQRRQPAPGEGDSLSVQSPAQGAATAHSTDTPVRVLAKPLVRKLAREKGVDLATIVPSGAEGQVTRADVLRATGTVGETLPSQSHDLPGEHIPVRGVQRMMAEAMVQSAFTAPHVTEWVDVDMSRSMEIIRRLRDDPRNADVRITAMALVATGLVRAARQLPRINSTWVDTAEGADVVIHRDVHLGIATDTPRGLVVTTIKGASSLGLVELARRIQKATDTARAGRSTPGDLTGSTISLTNVGVFGVDGGTPILTPGQTSILAMGRIIDRPWVVDGQVVARPVMTLSLSFDHRVIDGALGSRALQSVATFLADPALELLLES